MDSLTALKSEKNEVSIDVALWNARAIESQRLADRIEITDDMEEEIAVGFITGTTKFFKDAEEERKSQVDPFNSLVKKINRVYKSISDPLSASIEIVKKKRSAYLMEKDRKIAEENRRRQEEHQKEIEEVQKLAAEMETEAPVIAPPPTILETKEAVRTENGSAFARKEWFAEVTDVELLYKTRPDLVKLETKLREIKSATKNGEQIPGLRVYQDYSQSTRTR
jgi:hypothetical protein